MQKKTLYWTIAAAIVVAAAAIIIFLVTMKRRKKKKTNLFVGSWLVNFSTDIENFYRPGSCFNLLYANFGAPSPGGVPEKMKKQVGEWRADDGLFIPSFNFGAPGNLVTIVNTNIGVIQDWADKIKESFNYDGIMFNYEPALNPEGGMYMDAMKKLVDYLDAQAGKGAYTGDKKYVFFSFGAGIVADTKPGAREAINFLNETMHGVKNITVFYDWQKYDSPDRLSRICEVFSEGQYGPMIGQSLFTLSGLQMNKYPNMKALVKDVTSGAKGVTFWVVGGFGSPPDEVNQKFIGNGC